MSRNTQLVFRDTDYRYGFHCTKHPTYAKTVREVAEGLPYSAFQIYVSNGRAYSLPEYNLRDLEEARHVLEFYDLDLYVHGCLLHNLCGAAKHRKDPKFDSALKRTIDGLTAETDIVAGLGGVGVVVHPNSCHDAKKGLFTASKTIEAVLTKNTVASGELAKSLGITQKEFKRRRRVILENSAQEGSKRGGTLEELAEMINGVDESVRDQVSVCIDTAHAFGAGIYDWGKPSEVRRFYEDFERIVGLRYLKVFHLNDSRCSEKKGSNAYFGSKKDRHENLGLGWIFSDEVAGETDEGSRNEGLKEFLLQAREHGIAIIGEPPATAADGGPGLGRRRDWGVVCQTLEDTEYPLEAVYYPET